VRSVVGGGTSASRLLAHKHDTGNTRPGRRWRQRKVAHLLPPCQKRSNMQKYRGCAGKLVQAFSVSALAHGKATDTSQVLNLKDSHLCAGGGKKALVAELDCEQGQAGTLDHGEAVQCLQVLVCVSAHWL